MKVQSIHDNSDLVKYFSSSGPNLESDFFMVIQKGSDLDNNDIPILSFSIPDLGVTFSNSSDLMNFSIGSVNISSLTLTYLVAAGKEDPIKQLWASQVNSTGSLVLLPKSNKPEIFIFRKLPGFDTSVQLMEQDVDPTFGIWLRGCKLSYPNPSVNLSSISPSVNTVVVTFDDYFII